MMRRLLLLAGEESGALYAQKIAAKVRECEPAVEIRGYGDYGFKVDDLGVMGIVQVVKKLRYFLCVKKTMEQAIDAWRPDVVCTVDYPGMNLKLTAYAKARGIRTVHVVCPQVWAWHQSRIPKVEASVDKICCFLPFEPKIFRPGLATFVGHPLVEELATEVADSPRKFPKGTVPVLAVLPGSRLGEIKHHMPTLLKVVGRLIDRIPDLQIIIPAANVKAHTAIRKYLDASSRAHRIAVRSGGARDVLRQADAAVVASGTATLEAALVGCPTVLVYHVDLLFEIICRFSLKGVKHIGLANIVAEKSGADCPMPELIQENFTVRNVFDTLFPWLTDAQANAQARSQLRVSTNLLRSDGNSITKIARFLV